MSAPVRSLLEKGVRPFKSELLAHPRERDESDDLKTARKVTEATVDEKVGAWLHVGEAGQLVGAKVVLRTGDAI